MTKAPLTQIINFGGEDKDEDDGTLTDVDYDKLASAYLVTIIEYRYNLLLT